MSAQAGWLGPYQIERELGRGGMGVVYLARDPELGRLVALKVLQRSSPTARQRLLLEARASAAIRHPNVVRVHDVRELEGNLVLVMDYVEGTNLGDRLQRQGTIPPREAARLTTDLARALAAGHGRRILHRDVKPDNVLLREHDGAALLTDFGLAKFQDETGGMTRSGVLLGTPLYASPEQLTGATLDARSDVYSLGALLYTMLCGEPPIGGNSLVQIVARVCSDMPPPPSTRQAGVPPWLDAICLQCLEKDPASRFPSAGELAQALQQGERNSQSSLSRAGGPALTTRSGVLTATVALLAVLAAGAVYLQRNQSSKVDTRVAELTQPPLPSRRLNLDLPSWAHTAGARDPRLEAHLVARKALLAGERVEGGTTADLQVLASLATLGWGQPLEGLDPEARARLLAGRESASEALAALAAKTDSRDPWALWASAAAARAVSELDRVDARVAAKLGAAQHGRAASEAPPSAWSALETLLHDQRSRSRGLRVLRKLRTSVPHDSVLAPALASELAEQVEHFFPDCRATTPTEAAEFEAWLKLVATRNGKPRTFAELFEVLPLVLHALAPRVRFGDLSNELRHHLQSAVDLVYAGFAMSHKQPSDSMVLLGPLVGMWPADRVHKLRRELLAEFSAIPHKTGEHALVIYIKVNDQIGAGERTQLALTRLMESVALALGNDLDPSWRERFGIQPAEALARPIAPCWVALCRFRFLMHALARDTADGRPLSSEGIDFYLRELQLAIEANLRTGIEPRFAFNPFSKLASRLANLASRHGDREDELLAVAEASWQRAHAGTLELLQDGRSILETHRQEVRESLLQITFSVCRHWVNTKRPRLAGRLVDDTLAAWELWDPESELLAYRCWLRALEGDPDVLTACARERERLQALPEGSAIHPNAFRLAKQRAEALLFAATVIAHVDAGNLDLASELASKNGPTLKGDRTQEVDYAMRELRRALKRN